jgi:hypothetical protein
MAIPVIPRFQITISESILSPCPSVRRPTEEETWQGGLNQTDLKHYESGNCYAQFEQPRRSLFLKPIFKAKLCRFYAREQFSVRQSRNGMPSSQLHQFLAQFRVPVRPRLVPIAGSPQAQQLAGPAFAQMKSGRDECNVLSQTGKLQPFFRMTAFSASRSSLRSATNCFNRGFSSSIYRRRCASLPSRLPYFDFQL